MDERAWRELAGSEKSVSGWSWNSVSASHGQLQPLQAHVGATYQCHSLS
jgi:hypothetical protein